MTTMLATDLDRTLLPNGPEPDDGNLSVLLEAVKMFGLTLVYVSGRNLPLFREAQEEFSIPEPDYFIGDVGTTLYIQKDDALVFDTEHYSYLKDSNPNWERKKIVGAIGIHVGLSLQEDEKQQPHKISYYLEPGRPGEGIVAHIKGALQGLGLDAVVISSFDPMNNDVGLIDVLPKNASKLGTLEYLRARLKVAKENLIYAGDSGNDLLPLTSGCRAILVNNAPPEVKQAVEPFNLFHGGTIYLAKGGETHNGNYASGIIEGLIAHGALSEDVLS